MTHTYTITGMTCSGCSGKVKNQLEQHKEVTSVEVDLEQGEVTIGMNKHVQTKALQQLFGAGIVGDVPAVQRQNPVCDSPGAHRNGPGLGSGSAVR